MAIVDMNPSYINALYSLRGENFFDPEREYSNEALKKLSQEGFLLSKQNTEEFSKDILNNKTLVYIDETSFPRGFIRIEEFDSIQNFAPDKEDKMIFENVNSEKDFYELPHAELGALVVEKDWRGRGIGRELRYSAINYLTTKGYKSVFTYVIFEPITNNPSLRLQEVMGFRQTAVVKYRWGLYNFCVGLFQKDLDLIK